LKLPPGDYKITELINGRTELSKSAAKLAEEGLPVSLGKREVAIFKLKRL
jgi:hypothetical protein